MKQISPIRTLLYFILILSCVETGVTFAQTKNKPGLGFTITKAKGAIVADGVLGEEDWKSAAVATNFFLNYPVDSLPPTFQTEVRVTYDADFFYMSFVCYDDDRPNVVQSLRRDYEWGLNDNVGVYMDPFNDFTNGFYFNVTPYGVQREGVMSGGGSDPEGYNPNWDNKWYSAVKRLEDRWVAELAIPFKSLFVRILSETRYPVGLRHPFNFFLPRWRSPVNCNGRVPPRTRALTFL
jgi:hypothetical protein